MFDWGALTTITPNSVARATSTLSNPMPARPTTTRSLAASRVGASTLVAERIISACAPSTAAISSSGDSPKRTSTSWPALRSSSSPVSAISSDTSTRATTTPFVLSSKTKGAEDLSARRNEFGEPLEAFREVLVAERTTESEETGSPERLAGHNRNLYLFEQGGRQFNRRRRHVAIQ